MLDQGQIHNHLVKVFHSIIDLLGFAGPTICIPLSQKLTRGRLLIVYCGLGYQRQVQNCLVKVTIYGPQVKSHNLNDNISFGFQMKILCEKYLRTYQVFLLIALTIYIPLIAIANQRQTPNNLERVRISEGRFTTV